MPLAACRTNVAQARNANGASALHAAAAAGSTDCAVLLLAAGARVAARDGEGHSCEQVARAAGHAQLAAMLREAQQAGSAGAGGDAAGTPRDPLGQSRSRVVLAPPRSSQAPPPRARPQPGADGRADDADGGADDDDSDDDDDADDGGGGGGHDALEDAAASLRDAAGRGDAAAVRLALAGPSAAALVLAAEAGGLTALHCAARGGSAACVAALLAAGADGGARTRKGNLPLAVACKHSQWGAAVVLLEAGVRADGVALLQAVRHGAAEGLPERLCAAGGLEVDEEGAEGKSALMRAAAAGEPTSIERLLELRADVSLADANGARALHYCADQGDIRCAQLLLRGGAAVDATDAHGNSALHAAGRRGHKALWAALLEANADPGALNARGRPPKLLDAADADAACAVM